MTDRKAFEAWISGPPYELRTLRYPDLGVQSPRQYRSYEVELAWDAWTAAVTAERERCASMLDAEHEKRKGMDNHAAVYARMIRESK